MPTASIIEDRREKPRTRVSRNAFVSDVESRFYYYCFIRDATQKGCRLYSPDALDFPATLWLYPDAFPAPLLGSIAWRRKKMAGIRFIKDIPSEFAADISRSPAAALTFDGIGQRIAERKATLRGTNRPPEAEADGARPPGRAATSFLATVAHELKTPLKSIAVALSQFVAKALRSLPKQLQDLILIVSRDTKRMEQLVDDLLGADKIERGKIPIRPVPADLIAVARDAVDADAEYVATHGVTCRLEAPDGEVMVRIDADRIRQVLSNLISNAAKFSRRGQEVVVRVERLDGLVRLSVIDHGAGIASEAQARMFDRSSSGAAGGAGLGLGICKSIVEHHGAKLRVDSELGRGSAFYFDLDAIERERVEI